MFLWPDGMRRGPQQSPLQDLINKANGDIGLLLTDELFMKSAKLGQSEAIHVLRQNTRNMLELLFRDLSTCKESIFEHLTEVWNAIIEIFELKLEPVQRELEALWEIIFSLTQQKNVPDPQWGFALKVFTIIQQSNYPLVSALLNRPGFLKSLFPSLQYTSATHIIISYFEMKPTDQQISFLEYGLERYESLDKLAVINFTFIVHETMTRIQSEPLIAYLTKGAVLRRMFALIRESHNAITLKNAAHIISLVTNYYSIKMQNIKLESAESEQIEAEFEKSEYFNTIVSLIPIFSEILRKQMKQNHVGLLKLKIVEIVDNLVRTTNLRLWDELEKAKTLVLVLESVEKFNKSDIFISYVDKLVQFIFDRALSEFHPFWAQQLIVSYKVHNRRIPVIEKQYHWFCRELDDKLLEEGDMCQYHDTLRQIQREFEQSAQWKRIKQQVKKEEERNSIVLGEYLNGPASPETPQVPMMVSALDVVDQVRDDGAAEGKVPDSIFIKCGDEPNKAERDAKDSDGKEFNFRFTQVNDDDDDEVVIATNTDALQKLQTVFRKLDENDQKDLRLRKRHSAQMETLGPLYVKRAKSLSNSCGDETQKKQALTYSVQLKQLNKNFEEFHFGMDHNRKILRNDDNRILKVDELDEDESKLKNNSSSQQKSEKLLKVTFLKEKLEVVAEVVQKPIRSLQFINFDKSKLDAEQDKREECSSAESVKFRKIREQDKAFLNYINSIK